MQTSDGRDAQWVAGFTQGVVAVMNAARSSTQKSFAPGGVVTLCNEVLMTHIGTQPPAPTPKIPQRTMATEAPKIRPKQQRSKSPKPPAKVTKMEIPKLDKTPIKGKKKASKEEPVKFPEPEEEEEAQETGYEEETE